MDKFSSILGSGFHCLHRIGTPAKREYKKAFYAALSEAMYAWDEDDTKNLYEAMKNRIDVNMDEFQLMWYYWKSYFVKCVGCHCLPPSRIYYRARAVFELFGNKIDSESKKPLFKNDTWKKVNVVLKEILKGFYSDPPGEVLYKYELTNKGEIEKGKDGISILKCI